MTEVEENLGFKIREPFVLASRLISIAGQTALKGAGSNQKKYERERDIQERQI